MSASFPPRPERARHYFDYNAGAPLAPAARRAMSAALEAFAAGGLANPSSVHAEGRAARFALAEARRGLARALGAAGGTMVFTSGASEALALALASAKASGARVLVAAGIEHPALIANAEGLGLKLAPVRVGADGVVDLDDFTAQIAAFGPAAIGALMAANNETGVIQPVAAASAIAHAAGAMLVADCAQIVGRIALDLSALGADFCIFSGHKAGGPAGIGALWAPAGVTIAPFLRGGGQEQGWRGGTENLLGAIGMAASFEAAVADLPSAGVRDAFEARLVALVPDCTIFGAAAARLPQTSCFGAAGLSAATLVMALDLAGFAVSAGAACSSGKIRPSATLNAMGVEPLLSESAIRVSFGAGSTREAALALAELWGELAGRRHVREVELQN